MGVGKIMTIKDKYGNEFGIGDTITVAYRYSTLSEVAIGIVTEIDEKWLRFIELSHKNWRGELIEGQNRKIAIHNTHSILGRVAKIKSARCKCIEGDAWNCQVHKR